MVTNVKPQVVRLIAQFRGFTNLIDSEVKLTDLELEGKVYTVRGNYDYHTAFGAPVEKGSFDIRLEKDTLDPVKVKITPGIH